MKMSWDLVCKRSIIKLLHPTSFGGVSAPSLTMREYICACALLTLFAVAGCGKTKPAAPANRAPDAPFNPIPANGASVSDTCGCLVYLGWSCSDPDAGDTLSYALYFDMADPPPLLDSNLSQTHHLPPALDTGMAYLWKVTARDRAGLETTGPLWRFTVTP